MSFLKIQLIGSLPESIRNEGEAVIDRLLPSIQVGTQFFAIQIRPNLGSSFGRRLFGLARRSSGNFPDNDSRPPTFRALSVSFDKQGAKVAVNLGDLMQNFSV